MRTLATPKEIHDHLTKHFSQQFKRKYILYTTKNGKKSVHKFEYHESAVSMKSFFKSIGYQVECFKVLEIT